MMTAGAAHGAGIYSARDFGTASGYASRRGGYAGVAGVVP